MNREEFKTLYAEFLQKVIKFTPVAPFIENELFKTYDYLTEQELRAVFNQFYLEIKKGRVKTGIEPSIKLWDKVVYSLYLDKTYKNGHRTKPITAAEMIEVGRRAKGVASILSKNNCSSEDFEKLIKSFKDN